MKLKNKVFVVTGAGSGIGRELVLQLLEEGSEIAGVDINQKAMEETKNLSGAKSENMSLHLVNIADKTAVENLPNEVIKEHGHVDGIINNAGIIQPFVKVNNLDYDAIERVMNINFYGTLYMTKTILPYLLKRPEGHLVNVSSMGGFLPVPGQSIYGASKAAVKLLTEGLHSELAETNVKVSVVFPGATETNISENSGLKRDSDADNSEEESNIEPLPAPEAAKAIIEGIKKDKARILVGKDTKMMNFLYSISPNFARKLIYKQMKSLLND